MLTCCQSVSLKAVRVSWATGAKQPGLHYSHLSGSTSVVLLDPLHWVSVTRENDNLNVSFWPAVCTATTAWQQWGGGGGLTPDPRLDTVCVRMCVCVLSQLLWFLKGCVQYVLHMGGVNDTTPPNLMRKSKDFTSWLFCRWFIWKQRKISIKV